MIIAHLTDLHIRALGVQSHGFLPASLVLQRAVERLNAMLPRPDLVLLTGDLTHAGGIAEYDALTATLARLTLPMIAIPGNHDSRENFLAAFPDLPLDRTGGFGQFIHDSAELRLIGLDSIKRGSSGGALCAERLAFLARALDGSNGKPVIIAMHHPPILVGMKSMDPIWLQDGRAEMAAILRQHPKVLAILCGHHHRPIVGQFHGVPVFCGPSLVAQGDFGLDPHDPNTFSEEPASFHVHWFTPENGLVTHTAYVDQFPGQYPW
jgi:3',5'-cyclic-AMP phosphodiesterase